MTDKPVRDYDKFMLRFPDGMRDAIAERAKASGRSMNSEIIQILEDAIFHQGGDLHSSDVHELRSVIKTQADLLSQYSEAIVQGTEMLRKINEKNKKPT